MAAAGGARRAEARVQPLQVIAEREAGLWLAAAFGGGCSAPCREGGCSGPAQGSAASGVAALGLAGDLAVTL